jgi:uncharacterized iron-regulated protein
MLHREPGSSPGAGVPRPAGEAAWYLFREVRIDGSTVRAAGSRRLSGPVQSRVSRRLTDELQLTTFRMELIPEQPLRYRPLEEIRVRFTSDELLAGGRALMQPAQKAIILAASRMDRSTALVRVKSLRIEGEKRWTGVVEIAERLP